MPLLRLIGLTLFITAIFLAMAAAITKTTHIRIQLPGANQPESADAVPGPMGGEGIAGLPTGNGVPVLPPPMGSVSASGTDQEAAGSIRFASVPIVWPLILAAGAGLLMWFGLSSDIQKAPTYKSKRRVRRRR